jgi:hypothetical protein
VKKEVCVSEKEKERSGEIEVDVQRKIEKKPGDKL